MTTRTCRECTTAFAVGLPACPNCASTDNEETGMPKITVHSGPSNKDEAGYFASRDSEEAQECPGTPSSPSLDTDETSSTKSKPALPKRARSTARRSSKEREGSSTARSTSTTSGPKTDD